MRRRVENIVSQHVKYIQPMLKLIRVLSVCYAQILSVLYVQIIVTLCAIIVTLCANYRNFICFTSVRFYLSIHNVTSHLKALIGSVL